MSIAIIHPEERVRNLLATMVKQCLEESPALSKWKADKVEQYSTLAELPPKTSATLIIGYFNRVGPLSEEVCWLRDFRKGGACAPLLAITFAGKGAANVFSQSVHRLLLCPFLKEELQDALSNNKLRPFIDETEAKDFVALMFGDPVLIESNLRRIVHDVNKRLWEDVERIKKDLELGLGKGRIQPLQALISEKSEDADLWKSATKKIEEELKIR